MTYVVNKRYVIMDCLQYFGHFSSNIRPFMIHEIQQQQRALTLGNLHMTRIYSRITFTLH